MSWTQEQWNEYAREYRKRDYVQVKIAAAARDKSYRKNYGITTEQYEEMLLAQGGRCAICGRTQEEAGMRHRLHVDHDHETDRVRGLLCYRCNTAMGWLDRFLSIIVAFKAGSA